jgi:hypothetical protein
MITETHCVLRDRGHRHSPAKSRAKLFGAFGKGTMQDCAANRKTIRVAIEGRISGTPFAQETNSAKNPRLSGWDLNAEAVECRHAIGQQAFATGFVDRRTRSIGDDHAEPTLPRRNRRG